VPALDNVVSRLGTCSGKNHNDVVWSGTTGFTGGPGKGEGQIHRKSPFVRKLEMFAVNLGIRGARFCLGVGTSKSIMLRA